ncbi:MAG: arginase family protein [Rubrobacteraceae bacterium]|nr:arginase family protein [Rubrobacteraceae bacterium]
MAKKLGLIGVPTSMGAFAPGQEKSPGALRDADLLGRLSDAGVEVVDHGDGGGVRRWRPDKGNRRAQNLPAVVEVARETAGRVEDAHVAGHLPLVVGGDCTIELGTVAGLLPSGGSLGLLYFDVHPDLNVPGSVGEGALDWMGVAHMLGEEGSAEPLSRLGPRFPLLAEADVFLFSYGPEQATEWERGVIDRRGLRGTPVEEVAADPEGAAARPCRDGGQV